MCRWHASAGYVWWFGRTVRKLCVSRLVRRQAEVTVVDGTPGRVVKRGLAAHFFVTRRRKAVGCVYMPLKSGETAEGRLSAYFYVYLAEID